MLAFEAIPTHVMIGLSVVDLVHVITKKGTRDVVFEWEFIRNID